MPLSPRSEPERSLALSAYMALSRVAEPVARRLLARRLARGKEDAARLPERLGHASRPRPEGALVWMHGASVGESLSLLQIIAALKAERPDLSFLVTTGTVTSARLMAERLPEGAIHQYVPLDALPAVDRFLAHWRPDLGLWVESELWPALIERAAAAGFPLALINARMSARSARGWTRAPAMIARLLSRFSAVLAQEDLSAERLRGLGAREVRAVGSLKAGVAPPDRPEAREAVGAAAGARPLWLAASTHKGEEDLVARAQLLAAARIPGLLCLLAPRHPERGPALEAHLRAEGYDVSRRGVGQLPGAMEDIHLLDTMGEMGAWLRLTRVAFVGGSLVNRGGHNPHEPATLGAAILHGPFTANFAGDYAALREAHGAREVAGPEALASALVALLGDAAARDRMTAAARQALGDGTGAVAATLEALLPLLPPLSQAGPQVGAAPASPSESNPAPGAGPQAPTS